MLKKILILVIAIIAIASARRSSNSGRCPAPVYRNDCNICHCSPASINCTILNCNLLSESVKRGNAVANSNLPQWPGIENATAVGQVYNWQCGYCVMIHAKTAVCESECQPRSKWGRSTPISQVLLGN